MVERCIGVIVGFASQCHKLSWREEDWQLREKWLNEEGGYTSKQLTQKWSSMRKINLGSEQILSVHQKKLGMEGKRIRKKPPSVVYKKVQRVEKKPI